MQLPVLIEPKPEGGFVATAGPSLGLTASGASAGEALAALESLVRDRVRAGGQVVSIEVKEQNPWNAVIGMYENDPLFDEWQEAVAEYRRARDNDPDTQ